MLACLEMTVSYALVEINNAKCNEFKNSFLTSGNTQCNWLGVVFRIDHHNTILGTSLQELLVLLFLYLRSLIFVKYFLVIDLNCFVLVKVNILCSDIWILLCICHYFWAKNFLFARYKP